MSDLMKASQGDPNRGSWEGIRHVCRKTRGMRCLPEKHCLLPVQKGKDPIFGDGVRVGLS